MASLLSQGAPLSSFILLAYGLILFLSVPRLRGTGLVWEFSPSKPTSNAENFPERGQQAEMEV